MRKIILILMSCVAICFAGCGAAGNRSGQATQTSANGVSTATYRDIAGTIDSIDDARGTIKITHGDIPGYMPAMTMDYAVKDKALLEKIKKGDQIRFTIQDNAGVVVISEIHPQ